MGQIFREWIFGLIAAAVIASAAQLFTVGSPVEKVTGFICSVMLMAALLSPLLKLDPDALSLSLASYRETVALLTEDLETQQNQLMRSYIEEQCAAYILDEAQILGIADGRVEVKAKWAGDSWIPCEATMTMPLTADQQRQLSNWMAAQLGITEERQYWNNE